MNRNDLSWEAKQLFESYRAAGYTESEAFDATRRSGLVSEPELARNLQSIFGLSSEAASTAAVGHAPQRPAEDVRGKTVDAFKGLFGLSDRAAQVAADGHDGPSPQSVSESLSSIEPNPANVQLVAAAIDEVATDLRRRGAAPDAAVREAAVEVMLKVPDTPGDRTSDWVARIAQRLYPWAYTNLGSSRG